MSECWSRSYVLFSPMVWSGLFFLMIILLVIIGVYIIDIVIFVVFFLSTSFLLLPPDKQWWYYWVCVCLCFGVWYSEKMREITLPTFNFSFLDNSHSPLHSFFVCLLWSSSFDTLHSLFITVYCEIFI